MQKAANQLCSIFQDVNFAWELLNAQIEIQMSSIAPGQTIAYLLQLYMRGVQKMNSLGDSRQSYFKNKVTTLMTKQTVIKSLKQNPMKKKTKHDQVAAKKETKETKQKQKTPPKKKNKKQQLNQLQLQQKRRQLEMRMAYVAEEHGPDSLKKIIAQQDHREQNISSKINKIINSHQQRLNERIRARKLKTSTFRSRSQINLQQNQMMMGNEYEKVQMTKQEDKQFSPFKKLLMDKMQKKQQHLQHQQQNGNIMKNNQESSSNKKQIMMISHKKYKSLEIQRDFQSPQKKTRKYTHDGIKINPRQSFS